MSAKRLLLLLLLGIALQLPATAADRAIEMRADRVVIFPQRLELTGEETLLDILLMYPDLMQGGFDDMVSLYSVRIDNVPVNLNARIFLHMVKARQVSKIQICDNTGVAKGTVGLNRVIDITLLRFEPGLQGDAGAAAGTDRMAQGAATARYGSSKTDIIGAALYTYGDQDDAIDQAEQVYLHMTNWFSPRDRLLTYASQQYYDDKFYGSGDPLRTHQTSYMARARYFHNFNDKGTELLVLGSYQHTSRPTVVATDDGQLSLATDVSAPMALVELNTPLGHGLDMMAGWEGDWTASTLHTADGGQQKYRQANNDLYLQYNYRRGRWLLALGDRVMFYHYTINGISHNETRNNLEASIVASLNDRSQAQVAYHRKFVNPTFRFTEKVTDDEWLLCRGNLKATYIDEVKLGYTYAERNLSLSAASYLLRMDQRNTWKLQTAAYYKTGILAVTAGANYYCYEGDSDFATFHIDPRLTLPWQMQLSAQAIFSTDDSELSHSEHCYLALQLHKQLGRHLDFGLDWHDIASSKYAALMASVNFKF